MRYLSVLFIFCYSLSGSAQFLGLTSEVHATSEYGTTHRIYAEFGTATDECLAVYSIGQQENNPVTLELGVTTSFYQWGLGEQLPSEPNLGSEIFPFLLSFFPEIGYDSWFTIGSETNEDGTISAIGMSDAFTEFNNGNGFILGEGAVGGAWYITPDSNPLAYAGDDGMVLLGQFTAADDAEGNPGHVTCDWNIQWRDVSNNSHDEIGVQYNTWDIPGCTETEACNYNLSATTDDGSCLYNDALGDCGGPCEADADADGICDNVDDCVGALDACGVCNGPGDIYECGCTEIPEGDCDCAGGQPEIGYDCNGNCLSDFNDNGICDIVELIEINDAVASGAFCGEGTIWNDSFGLCLPLDLCPSDIDEDGLTGVTDLMELLSLFGTACEAEDVDPELGEFTCGDLMNYHGYDYATVQIGEQCWFAENLRNTNYRNFDPIPTGLDNEEWQTSSYGAYTIYDNDSTNAITYGLLYNFHAVVDSRGLCPIDWHVPSDIEFMALEMELGLNGTNALATGWRGPGIGDALKESPLNSPGWDGLNTTGFSALSGGSILYNGQSQAAGNTYYNDCALWTSTPYEQNDAMYRGLNSANNEIWRGWTANGYSADAGMSVRCLKDSE